MRFVWRPEWFQGIPSPRAKSAQDEELVRCAGPLSAPTCLSMLTGGGEFLASRSARGLHHCYHLRRIVPLTYPPLHEIGRSFHRLHALDDPVHVNVRVVLTLVSFEDAPGTVQDAAALNVEGVIGPARSA